jgi:hypothetical protein
MPLVEFALETSMGLTPERERSILSVNGSFKNFMTCGGRNR